MKERIFYSRALINQLLMICFLHKIEVETVFDREMQQCIFIAFYLESTSFVYRAIFT